MTQIESGLMIQATQLAAHLQTAATPHKLVPYRGVLTPRELDAPEAEIAALAAGAAIHDLGWLRRVAVRGEDRFRWLSGMVTNTVNDLAPNAAAWNLVLNAQGRIQGDLTVWRVGEGLSPLRNRLLDADPELELVIAADQYDKLMAHLNHFIIMDDVELVPLNNEAPGEGNAETVVGLTGPDAEAVLARMGLPTLAEPMTGVWVEWNGVDLRMLRGYDVLARHYQIWTPAAGLAKLWLGMRTAGATPVGCAAVEALRIAEGIPAYGVDIAERDLPQETSQLRALHFNKGCYLGQEIVERIRSRGNVHRHLRQMELIGPLPLGGTDLFFNGEQAGQISSAAALPLEKGVRTFALAMVRSEAENKAGGWTYTAEGSAGMARLLDAAPSLV